MTQADLSTTKSLGHRALRAFLLHRARGLSLLVTTLAGIAIWLIFYPGTLAVESIGQYIQAKTGRFDSWHPPIMAIVLSLFLRVGLDIGSLMFIQCLAGVLGLRALLLAQLRILRGRCTPRSYWTTTAFVLVILSPLTPAAIYITTFWKDSWTAILLVWVLAIFLELFRRAPRLSQAGLWARFLILVGVMTVAALPRHNTLTTTPVMGLLLCLILVRRRDRQEPSRHPRIPTASPCPAGTSPGLRLCGTWSQSLARPVLWLAAAIPLASVLASGHCLAHLFDVKHTCPGNHVKVLDLVGLYVRFPQLRSEIPYTSGHVYPGVERHFRFGELSCLAWEHPEIVDPDYLDGSVANSQLDAEYRHVIRACPAALAYVKLIAFQRLLDPASTRVYYFGRDIAENPYGLEHTALPCPIRPLWYSAADISAQLSLARWVNYQGLWFDLGLIGLAVSLGRLWRGNARGLLDAAVLLLPLSYTAGFALATTGMDYRFLYPATLLTQTLAAGMLIAWWTNRSLLTPGLMMQRGRPTGTRPTAFRVGSVAQVARESIKPALHSQRNRGI